MKRIKKDDEVIVITGKDKGKRCIVSQVLRNDKVVVDGINLVKKHVKPNPMAGVEGGIQTKEMPIHISNIALYNPETGKADRVGFKLKEDGTKVRFFKSNGNLIGAES